jgi:hypothetical protein
MGVLCDLEIFDVGRVLDAPDPEARSKNWMGAEEGI